MEGQKDGLFYRTLPATVGSLKSVEWWKCKTSTKSMKTK